MNNPVAKRNGDFLLRTKTNIRGSITSEYSYSYEYSFMAEYSAFCRIFGNFTEYMANYSQNPSISSLIWDKYSVKWPNIRQNAEYSAINEYSL